MWYIVNNKIHVCKFLTNILSDSMQWSSQSSLSVRFPEEWIRKGLRWFYSWARKYIPPCHWPWCVAAMQVIQTHKALLTHRQCWHCLLSPKRTLGGLYVPLTKASIVFFFFIMARRKRNRIALMTFKPKFRLTIKCSAVVTKALQTCCCRIYMAFRGK